MDNANKINRIAAENIRVLRAANGGILDATDVVAHYLQTLPGRRASPLLNRIHLLKPLPPSIGVNPEIQPLRGAPR